jgi:hypothetical protein
LWSKNSIQTVKDTVASRYLFFNQAGMAARMFRKYLNDFKFKGFYTRKSGIRV